jgi:hypothetical protein
MRWLFEGSTIGSLPFLDVERTALASVRVVPEGAVTRSVDMTAVTGSSCLGWNWMSRLVIMPISGERRRPFSAVVSLCNVDGVWYRNVAGCLLIGLKIVPPHYDEIVLDERKL